MHRWCDRGAVGPLRVLLRAYPGPLWHAYHRMELLDAMLELHRGPREDLLEDEHHTVGELLDLLGGPVPKPIQIGQKLP